MTKAIVTLVIGDKYKTFWQQHCEASWRAYAERHGYDIILIEEPIRQDCGERSVHWQKLLILGQEKISHYDRVVWIDADIVINPASPCIVDTVPEGKIGAGVFGELVGDLDERHLERWTTFFAERGKSLSSLQSFRPNYYRDAGLDMHGSLRFNTGVLVFSPSRHASFLEGVFEKYEKNCRDYEQTYLSYELIRQGIYHIVDGRFNAQAGEEFFKYYPFLSFSDGEIGAFSKNTNFLVIAQLCLLTLFDNNYFIHFCGVRWHAPLLTDALKYFSERNFRALSRDLFLPRKANS